MIACLLLILCLNGCFTNKNKPREEVYINRTQKNQKNFLCKLETVYCYKSLGKINCFAQPLKNQNINLVYYGLTDT